MGFWQRLGSGRWDVTRVIVSLFGLAILAVALVGAVATLQGGRYSANDWLSFFVFGLTQGAVYALIALGYTLVYGVLLMINFAHSEVFMGGTYIAFFAARALDEAGWLDRSPFLALLIILAVSMTVSVLMAVGLERVAYRPLRGAPRLVPLITAIGASFFFQYSFRSLFGSSVKVYPDVRALNGHITIGPVQVSWLNALVIIAAVVMMLVLYWFVRRTKTGTAMRAVAEDREAAALMGIDVNRVIVTTFAIGAALAGAAGVLYALLFKQVSHTMGFVPGIKAFTAAVLGGIGNVPGAMFGGLFLGIFESIGPSLFFSGLGVPSPNQLKDVIAFSMLVLVLIFRPTGLLGEVLATKKA